jgi:hypothetical protein
MVTHDLISEDDIAKLIIPDDLPDEPSFKAYIEAKVYDKEGHLIQYRRQPMRSLTQYFLALMAIPLVGTYTGPNSNTALPIITNTFGFPSTQTTYSSDYADVDWDWSIVVGSGSQAFSLTLTGLAMPIANGSGVGELQYGSISISWSSNAIFVSQIFYNNSGGTINVTEIGLSVTVYLRYINSSDSYDATTFTGLLSYDTLSTPVSIPNGSFAVFQITLTFSG